MGDCDFQENLHIDICIRSFYYWEIKAVILYICLYKNFTIISQFTVPENYYTKNLAYISVLNIPVQLRINFSRKLGFF